MAFPLLKLYWLFKVLKYPFAAVLQTLREYRRHERDPRTARPDAAQTPTGARPPRRLVVAMRERTFFQNPWRALRDRRFWIRGATNGAELCVHVLQLWAFVRNSFCRGFYSSFAVWDPHHDHEKHLFERVEFERWRDVLWHSAVWCAAAFRVWHASTGAMIRVEPHGRYQHWRQVRFDGAAIAAYVGARPWKRPIREHRRRGGQLTLRLEWLGPRRARALLIDPGGEVLQSVALGPG